MKVFACRLEVEFHTTEYKIFDLWNRLKGLNHQCITTTTSSSHSRKSETWLSIFEELWLNRGRRRMAKQLCGVTINTSKAFRSVLRKSDLGRVRRFRQFANKPFEFSSRQRFPIRTNIHKIILLMIANHIPFLVLFGTYLCDLRPRNWAVLYSTRESSWFVFLTMSRIMKLLISS